MNCPDPKCASTDTVKNGRRPSGVQRYMCKTCKRYFTGTASKMGRPLSGDKPKTPAERKRESRARAKKKELGE